MWCLIKSGSSVWIASRAPTPPESRPSISYPLFHPFLPMIPLSLLSRVELGLVMVPQGLERLRGGRPAVLLRVEHGLSVQGDAVLLVKVEQGLMPWLVAEDCWREAEKEEKGEGTAGMRWNNQTHWQTARQTYSQLSAGKCLHFCSMSSGKGKMKKKKAQFPDPIWKNARKV